MATSTELEDAADAAAAKPQSMAADGVSVTTRTLKELDDHIDRKANRAASRKDSGGIGVKFFGLKMPGAGGCP